MSHLARIGSHCPGEGGDETFFYISRDHIESRHSVGEIPSPWIKKIIVRTAELNNKNIYVLETGNSLCYKLGQLCFITT